MLDYLCCELLVVLIIVCYVVLGLWLVCCLFLLFCLLAYNFVVCLLGLFVRCFGGCLLWFLFYYLR